MDTFKAYFSAALSAVALFSFIWLYGIALRASWSAPPPGPLNFSDAMTNTATTLAGLVGGIVAAAFGLKYPGRTVALNRMAYLVAAQPAGAPPAAWKLYLSGAYVIVYFAMGIAAIAVWIRLANHGVQAPDLLRNLALICLGLAVSLVNGWIRG